MVINRSLVKSAARVLDILGLLSVHPNGLSIQEISDKLSIPQSSTFSLIQTMYFKGFLQETASKKYKLSPKLIEIGTSAMESLDFHAQAQPYLQDLMQKVNETVFMAVLSDDEIIYVSKTDSNRSIKINVQVGSKKPLHCTALGKIFLTYLPKEERRKILLASGMPATTKRTITKLEDLEQQLDSIRENGFSTDNEESEEGVGCFAAPIFDRNGQVIAAISVSGPYERISLQKKFLVNCLLETATAISRTLGYHGTISTNFPL